MIKDRDIQFARYRSRIEQFEDRPEFSIKYINKENLKDYEGELRKIIYYINQDIPDWDLRPNFLDVKNRLSFNSSCFIFYFNNFPIGWYWINDNVSFNFVDVDKILPDECCYGGNAFVTNQIERPVYSGRYMYCIVTKYIFNQLGYKKIVSYVEEWNSKGIKATLNAGGEVENWFNS